MSQTSFLGLPTEIRLQIYRLLLPSTLYVQSTRQRRTGFSRKREILVFAVNAATKQRIEDFYSLQQSCRNVYREIRDLKPCGSMTLIFWIKEEHYLKKDDSPARLPLFGNVVREVPWKEIKTVMHRPSESEACLDRLSAVADSNYRDMKAIEYICGIYKFRLGLYAQLRKRSLTIKSLAVYLPKPCLKFEHIFPYSIGAPKPALPLFCKWQSESWNEVGNLEIGYGDPDFDDIDGTKIQETQNRTAKRSAWHRFLQRRHSLLLSFFN